MARSDAQESGPGWRPRPVLGQSSIIHHWTSAFHHGAKKEAMRTPPSRRLDRRVIRVWRLSAAITIIIWAVICLVPLGWSTGVVSVDGSASDRTATILAGVTTGVAAVFAVLLVVCVAVLPKIRWSRWRFDIGDDEIDICKGIWWRKRLIIPLIRVQNVETGQGPILRANGLASITVSTAAGDHEIPGLAVAEAEAVRDQVAVLARMAQDDV